MVGNTMMYVFSGWAVENISLVVIVSYLVLSIITACIFEKLGGGMGNPEKYLAIGLCWPIVMMLLVVMGFAWMISKFEI